MSINTIINKYRPADFDEVMGHDPVVAALRRAMAESTCPHAYLMTGPGGIGKTTIARIIAKDLQCDDVTEIDAASHNGIDDMRGLVELGNHRSLSGAGRRAFIIDECHALSKAAWQAILKLLEEPPEHLYLMLCTTELIKVPETIVIRCYHVQLRAVRPDAMGELLEAVSDAEGWTVKADVISAVIQAATGQPRKALSLLQSVHDADSKDEVSRIISLGEATDGLIQLARLLLDGNRNWERIQALLECIDDADYENGLGGIGRYVANAMTGARSVTKAQRAWMILDALTFPTTTYDRKVHFLAGIGRLIFAEQDHS